MLKKKTGRKRKGKGKEKEKEKEMEMEREKEKEKKKEANRGAILCATSLFQSSLPTSYPMNNTGGLFFLQESRSKNTI